MSELEKPLPKYIAAEHGMCCLICDHCKLVDPIPLVVIGECQLSGDQFTLEAARARRCDQWWPQESTLARIRKEHGDD